MQCPLVLDSCSSMTTAAFFGDSKLLEGNSKGCYRNDQCFNGSLNYGSVRTTFSTSCCNTDNCNTRTPAAVVNNFTNGRQCFSCVTTNNCSLKLPCLGNEDRCVTASVDVAGQTLTSKGCVTSNVCSGFFAAQLESTAVDLYCCEGNLCNSAWRAGHSVLLLFWTLLSVLLLQ
ncbi:urokinase plasminogen activator surface receptor-like isoform X2 [Sardina pilchardus]